MNVENINLAIQMMKRIDTEYMPHNFSMDNFQDSFDIHYETIYTEDAATIMDCGTACCFSGWLAIADEFKDYPGKHKDNAFSIGELSYVESVAKLLGISTKLAEIIIYPRYDAYEDNSKWIEVWSKYDFDMGDLGISYDWNQIRPEHIIDILERVKSGELT